MNILHRPIGKYLLAILGGLAIILLASDLSVVKRVLPTQRELIISGTVDPGLSLIFSSSYLARTDGFGCRTWSLFAGWQPRYSGERRVAQVRDGRFEVSIPVNDRSAERCGYEFRGVGFGIASNGESPNRWIALFDYSNEMPGTETAFANPLDAYCTPVPGASNEWVCSRRPDAPVVLGYPTDRMPAAMTMNIHVQTSVPYQVLF